MKKESIRRDRKDPLIVKVTRYFVVAQASDCTIPGYLIIEPLAPARHIWMLPQGARRELGSLQAACAMAVYHISSPIRVYCLAFGEQSHTYHCHVFPRSKELTSEYLRFSLRSEQQIRGPLLFDWARDRYRGNASLDPVILNVVARLRSILKGNAGFV